MLLRMPSQEEKLIVVTFKLPLIVEENEKTGEFHVKASKSILNNHLFNLQQRHPMMKTTWIGWPGIFVEDEAKQEQIRKILAEFQCVPVFHKKDVLQKFLQFHELVLRPLFHNFKNLDGQQDKDEENDLW